MKMHRTRHTTLWLVYARFTSTEPVLVHTVQEYLYLYKSWWVRGAGFPPLQILGLSLNPYYFWKIGKQKPSNRSTPCSILLALIRTIPLNRCFCTCTSTSTWNILSDQQSSSGSEESYQYQYRKKEAICQGFKFNSTNSSIVLLLPRFSRTWEYE